MVLAITPNTPHSTRFSFPLLNLSAFVRSILDHHTLWCFSLQWMLLRRGIYCIFHLSGIGLSLVCFMLNIPFSNRSWLPLGTGNVLPVASAANESSFHLYRMLTTIIIIIVIITIWIYYYFPLFLAELQGPLLSLHLGLIIIFHSTVMQTIFSNHFYWPQYGRY